MTRATIALGSALLSCLVLCTATSATACSIRQPGNQEAVWAAYRDGAAKIFVGQVVALHPYTRAERRELDDRRIAGVQYGTRAGWADIAPVETILGPADGLRARYSNGNGCGRDLWNANVGDFVLVVIGGDGSADVLDERNLEDPILRRYVQSYWN